MDDGHNNDRMGWFDWVCVITEGIVLLVTLFFFLWEEGSPAFVSFLYLCIAYVLATSQAKRRLPEWGRTLLLILAFVGWLWLVAPRLGA